MRWGIVAVAAVAIIAAPIAWYLTARPVALLMQGEPESGVPLNKIGWNGTYLTIDGRTFDTNVLTSGQDLQNTQGTQFGVDAQHNLIVTVRGKTSVLGSPAGAVMNGGQPEPAFAPARGDQVSFGRKEGWYAWPNWFEMNFMTGNSPQWKRFVTYRLIWKKPSGETLTLNWRFEHYYYQQNGWLDADMTGEGCGLVGASLEPAPRN